jgi:ABC-type multidrug transport system fused ATPase/permease subunit
VLKDARPATPVKPISFLPRVWRQGRNYFSLVWWLLCTAFKGRTWKLAAAVGLSLLGLATQGAAIYAVYWYGRQMEKGGAFTVPLVHIDINLKEQPEWLWAIVVFSTSFFILSAALLYLSRRQVLNIVQEHYSATLEQLALLTNRLPDPRVKLASSLFVDYGFGGIATGARRGTLIVVSSATTITALVGGLGAAFFLFRIDLPLTLLIIVSAGVAALLLYPLTLRGVASAKRREKAQEAFRLEYKQLIEKRLVNEPVTNFKAAEDLADAYLMRRRVLTELIFAIEVGITVILGMVVWYMASQALAGREQWAIFIAYIGALRMTLNGGAQAVRAFASVSRYYPQIVRYALLVKDMQKINDTEFAKVRRGDKVILGTLTNGQDVVAEVGDCLALLTLEIIHEVEFAFINARLPNSTGPLGIMSVDPDKAPNSPAAIALLSFDRPAEKEVEQLRAWRDGDLKDKVTLIVHRDSDNIGMFGETRILVLNEGEMQRYLPLGTEEADATMKEFAAKAAAKRSKRGLIDTDEDEEED